MLYIYYRMMVSIIVFLLFMMGLFGLKKIALLPILLLPLLVICIIFWHNVNQVFAKPCAALTFTSCTKIRDLSPDLIEVNNILYTRITFKHNRIGHVDWSEMYIPLTLSRQGTRHTTSLQAAVTLFGALVHSRNHLYSGFPHHHFNQVFIPIFFRRFWFKSFPISYRVSYTHRVYQSSLLWDQFQFCPNRTEHK